MKLYGFCPGTGHNRGAIMEKRSGIDAVRNFWEQVWRSPQNFDAIDDLVVEDFVIIPGAAGSKAARHSRSGPRTSARPSGTLIPR